MVEFVVGSKAKDKATEEHEQSNRQQFIFPLEMRDWRQLAAVRGGFCWVCVWGLKGLGKGHGSHCTPEFDRQQMRRTWVGFVGVGRCGALGGRLIGRHASRHRGLGISSQKRFGRGIEGRVSCGICWDCCGSGERFTGKQEAQGCLMSNLGH